MKKLWVLIFIIFSADAQAYIPPSQFIIHKMALKHAGFAGVKLKNKLILQPSGITFQETVLIDFHARAVRSRISDNTGNELYVGDHHFGLVDFLLFESNEAQLSKHLEISDSLWLGRKVETAGTKIAWVLGPKDDSKSQLWIEKDQFLPFRFLSNGKKIGFQFDSFRFYKEFPYPSLTTSFKMNEKLEEPYYRVELVELHLIEEAKGLLELKTKIPSGFTELGKASSSEIYKFLNDYHKF